ncbi:hypothetical protein ACM66B_003019 [Microbotryomycetes sp. NB124-2]
MPLDTHIKRGHPITFGVLILTSFIEMVQTAVLTSSFNRNGAPSGTINDRVRFLLFTSIWTLFFAIAYLAGFMTSPGSFLFSIASHAVWLTLTWIFWLAGAAAITQALGGGLDCGDVSIGSCNQLNSALAFGWINWILITFAFAIILLVGARSARRGDGFGSGLTA